MQSIQIWNQWVKTNWFTVIAIIIILGAVIVELKIGQNKQKLINDCNEHWKKEVEAHCPSVLNDAPIWMGLDMSGLNET